MTTDNTVFKVEVILPLAVAHAFSYLSSTKLQKGTRVEINFRSKQRVGLVVDCQLFQCPISNESSASIAKLKAIDRVVDEKPLLTVDVMRLVEWMVEYHHYWPGEIWQLATPKEFWNLSKINDSERKSTPKSHQKSHQSSSMLEVAAVDLNEQQQYACDQLQQSIRDHRHFKTWLLHGVTGSGKTEVYLHAAQQAIKQGGQVLMMVPEIGLTQQNIQRISQRFCEVVIYHSGLTPKARRQAWQRVHQSTEIVVLATRSGIFLPFQSLSLIIVDEEHDDSYKHMDGCRYQARDVAIMRAYQAQIPIILGSATPSYETLRNAQLRRYELLRLTERAVATTKPRIRFVDMSKRNNILSDVLVESMNLRLQRQEQILLFLNRRGFSPVIWCEACSWHPSCHFCQRSPTYHQFQQLLHCHLCDWKTKAPAVCPNCGSKALIHLGVGTEQVEQLLKQTFPAARLARLDRDTTQKKGSLEKLIQSAHELEIDILLGTQMLSKGHDLPQVTLVGILNIDQGLLSPFYRSEEKLMQLITQVAGRSGRGEKAGEVILQTSYPDNPLLQNIFQYGYWKVAEMQLDERRQSQLPPWQEWVLFRVEGTHNDQTKEFIQRVYQLFKQHQSSIPVDCRIMSVSPASIEKLRNHYRWQFIITASQKKHIQTLLKATMPTIQQWHRPRGLRWYIDLTPTES